MARKKIEEAIKQKIVEAYAGGLSMRKIAKEYGVSPSSVNRIIKETKGSQAVKQEKAGKTERQKRIEELEKRIADLEKTILDIETGKGLCK